MKILEKKLLLILISLLAAYILVIVSVFLRAEYPTYKSVFPQVYLFLTEKSGEGKDVQNIILVALKSSEIPDFQTGDSESIGYLDHL